MMTHDRHDTGSSGEIEGLERKIAELRFARAQMHAERDEHLRDATRAATVRDGLASLHRELSHLAAERADARDAAERDRAAIALELTQLEASANDADFEVRALVERLDEARARAEEMQNRYAHARSRATDAERTEASARDEHDEARRTAAELEAKFAIAASEAAVAETRSAQFVDIEQTLDREEASAEAALVTIRARYEATQLKADLDRIRTLEARLASERETLEARLRALDDRAPGDAQAKPMQSTVMTPPNGAPGVADTAVALPFADAPNASRVSLASRLARDFGEKP